MPKSSCFNSPTPARDASCESTDQCSLFTVSDSALILWFRRDWRTNQCKWIYTERERIRGPRSQGFFWPRNSCSLPLPSGKVRVRFCPESFHATFLARDLVSRTFLPGNQTEKRGARDISGTNSSV